MTKAKLDSQARRRLLLFTLVLAGLTTAPGAWAQFIAGRDYLIINPAQPTDTGGKVEVLEFFWYGCPHCDALQAPLGEWLKNKPADVEFRRAPAVLGQSWIPLTQAFFTLEAMGLTPLWCDLTSDDVRPLGSCVRVVVPEMLPLAVGHAARWLATPRLQAWLGPAGVNPYPQPLP